MFGRLIENRRSSNERKNSVVANQELSGDYSTNKSKTVKETEVDIYCQCCHYYNIFF